ncbi:Uncharacterized protein PBTT_04010 [Plasmodiophora brassicae]
MWSSQAIVKGRPQKSDLANASMASCEIARLTMQKLAANRDRDQERQRADNLERQLTREHARADALDNLVDRLRREQQLLTGEVATLRRASHDIEQVCRSALSLPVTSASTPADLVGNTIEALRTARHAAACADARAARASAELCQTRAQRDLARRQARQMLAINVHVHRRWKMQNDVEQRVRTLLNTMAERTQQQQPPRQGKKAAPGRPVMPKTIAYEHLSTHDKLFALQKFLDLFDETKGAAVQSK